MNDPITPDEFDSRPTVTSRVSMFSSRPRLKKREVLVLALMFIAALGILGTIYFYHRYDVLKKNPNAEQQAEVSALVAQVGKLMLLPSETPTVAVVEDTSVLKGQPFFVNAKNGDKALVFVTARQAILYRPSENKIINVAPLYLQDQGQPNIVAQKTAASTSSTTKATALKTSSSTSAQ